MPIDVPAEKRVVKQTVPPAGVYVATITSAVEGPPEDYVALIKWRFRAEGRQWTLPQHVIKAEELGDILVDLGLAGQSVELSDMLNKKAKIVVKTYGGRNSAKVKDTRPLDAE